MSEKPTCPTSVFPDAIDGYATLPPERHNAPIDICYGLSKRSAIINIELTLGTNVQGDYNNVRERLEALEEGIGGDGGDALTECCDLQATTDAGNVTTNGVVIGRIASAAILSNVQVMREDLQLLNGYNGTVVGPFGIDDGVSLTIPEGSVFVVI
jgi:hypothetical protein